MSSAMTGESGEQNKESFWKTSLIKRIDNIFEKRDHPTRSRAWRREMSYFVPPSIGVGATREKKKEVFGGDN